jgi:hypothetical protein
VTYTPFHMWHRAINSAQVFNIQEYSNARVVGTLYSTQFVAEGRAAVRAIRQQSGHNHKIRRSS